MKALADASAPRTLWGQWQVQHFFSACKRNPAAASDLITCMAAGQIMHVENIPVCLLPAVVLLATVGLREYQQQIVDDYVYLLQRMSEVFDGMAGRSPRPDGGLTDYEPSRVEYTHHDCDHPSLNLVSLLCIGGPRGEYWLNTHPDAGYIYVVYEVLVNAELEQLFPSAAKPNARR